MPLVFLGKTLCMVPKLTDRQDKCDTCFHVRQQHSREPSIFRNPNAIGCQHQLTSPYPPLHPSEPLVEASLKSTLLRNADPFPLWLRAEAVPLNPLALARKCSSAAQVPRRTAPLRCTRAESIAPYRIFRSSLAGALWKIPPGWGSVEWQTTVKEASA